MSTTAAKTVATVAGVMTPVPVTIAPDTTCAQLRDMRGAVRTGGVPVVGPNGTLLGVVSELDCEGAGTARDLMTAPSATTVSPDTSLEQAAALVREGAQRIFVVREGKLIGVVARQDLLATVDQEIARQIERTVAGMLPDLDPRCLRAAVDDGQVLLVGRVPWHRDIDTCSRVAAAVPGVQVVVNRLDYVWDDRPRGRWSMRHR